MLQESGPYFLYVVEGMIKVLVIGKTKEKYFQQGIDEFLKRLRRFARVEYAELSEKAIISSLKDGFVVALDVRGKELSSEELAVFVKKKEIEGRLVFCVGDEGGLPEEVMRQASLRLSMSRMTFPHELARLMFLEQLYRAFSINKGLPYHK